MKRFVAIALLLVPATLAAQGPSIRGDANADNAVNTADVGFLAANLLGSGPDPIRSCLADVNADASVSPADIFRLIDFVAAGGAAPPPQPAEVCNDSDDDCDGATDDGFDFSSDENNCGFCNTVCQPIGGANLCTSGACNPVCNSGSANCDSNPNNGCESVSYPQSCSIARPLTQVSGDAASSTTFSGFGQGFFVIQIVESSAMVRNLSAEVRLTSDPGTLFVLRVRCGSCNSGESVSVPTNPTRLNVFSLDSASPTNNSFTIFIEVTYFSGDRPACGTWTLLVRGDVPQAPDQLCD